MPRTPRLVLPEMPHHVVHRGINRAAIFVDDADRHRFRSLLRTALASREVALHAYVLMDNHVHLLASPSCADGLSLAIRSLAQRYAQYFNTRHQRCGSLWEGRFKSFVVDKDRYLLAVYRYIELNPVRAGLAERADEFPWSSARGNLGIARDPLLQPHPFLLELGTDPVSRHRHYAQWVSEGMSERELSAIRRYSAQERALGDPRFQAMVAKMLGRPVEVRRRGRPRRSSDGNGDGCN